jgi:hypothetical protein
LFDVIISGKAGEIVNVYAKEERRLARDESVGKGTWVMLAGSEADGNKGGVKGDRGSS